MILLGIDPGLATTGWGVIKHEKGNLQKIDYGVVSTSTKLSFPRRLEKIHSEITKIIKKYKPQVVAVENIFFCKNAKTAMLVGQARGVILIAAIQNKKEVYEYTPLQVKQAICAYGRADKKQIQSMVKILLNLKEAPKSDDAADALAIAICCAHSM